MPCMKCNNGKWKYGMRGRCIFLTKVRCEEARAAIHASILWVRDKLGI